jgi:hypothetical protein
MVASLVPAGAVELKIWAWIALTTERSYHTYEVTA